MCIMVFGLKFKLFWTLQAKVCKPLKWVLTCWVFQGLRSADNRSNPYHINHSQRAEILKWTKNTCEWSIFRQGFKLVWIIFLLVLILFAHIQVGLFNFSRSNISSNNFSRSNCASNISKNYYKMPPLLLFTWLTSKETLSNCFLVNSSNKQKLL